MVLGQDLLVHDGAARRDLSQSTEVATCDGSLRSKQQVLVLCSMSLPKRFGSLVELDRIYLAALIESDDDQGRQATQELSQYSLAVIEGNDPSVHHTVRRFYTAHNLSQGRLGNGDPESGLDRQGRSDHVGRRTGATFSWRQLASNGQKAARVQVENVHQFICQSPGLIFVRRIDANLAGPGRCREPGGRIPRDRQGNEEFSLLVREYSLEQFAERAETPPDARLCVSFARLFPKMVVADVAVHAPSRVLL